MADITSILIHHHLLYSTLHRTFSFVSRSGKDSSIPTPSVTFTYLLWPGLASFSKRVFVHFALSKNIFRILAWLMPSSAIPPTEQPLAHRSGRAVQSLIESLIDVRARRLSREKSDVLYKSARSRGVYPHQSASTMAPLSSSSFSSPPPRLAPEVFDGGLSYPESAEFKKRRQLFETVNGLRNSGYVAYSLH